MKKTIIIIGIIAIIVAGVFLVTRLTQQNASKNIASNFQTYTVEKGNLTALVGGTGSVITNQTALVSWQTTGRINEIQVAVGDTVKKDQILAKLEYGSLPQNVILAEAELVTAKRNLDNLLNSDAAKAQAQANLATLADALEKAKTKRESKEYKRASQNTIDEAYANYIVAKNNASEWEQRYDNVDHLPEDDPIRAGAFAEWAAAKAIMDRAYANWRYVQGMPSEGEIDIAEGNLALAQAQYDDALRTWERLKNGPDPDDIRAAEAQIAAIEATIDTIYLRAPFSGTITEVSSKPGNQVAPGVVSFRVDDLSHLQVVVEVPEIEINRLKTGMLAKVTFDAIPNKDYTGSVIEVARVANIAGGIVNFSVTIELTDADEQVLPGMTAAVNIIVSEIENVMVIPKRAVRLKDGQRVVYIQKPGELLPIAINVTIGASSDLYSEVSGGELKVGDVIVLNPPTSFSPGEGHLTFGN
jgi:HlyD family secretion protein